MFPLLSTRTPAGCSPSPRATPFTVGRQISSFMQHRPRSGAAGDTNMDQNGIVGLFCSHFNSFLLPGDSTLHSCTSDLIPAACVWALLAVASVLGRVAPLGDSFMPPYLLVSVQLEHHQDILLDRQVKKYVPNFIKHIFSSMNIFK